MTQLVLAASDPPQWYHWLSWAMLGLGFASALVILVDELVLGYRQHMAIMNLVHPITALYWGPVWVWAYFTRGRKASNRWVHRRAMQLLDEAPSPTAAKRKGEGLEMQGRSTETRDLRPWHVGDAVSHCGAGCTLGDIAAEWVVLALGVAWFGTWSGYRLPEELLLDFLFAWTLGIVFQYLTIAPMTGEKGGKGILRAIRVDTASMQIGMILGFFTAWPVNRWLVSNGIKEKMDHRRHLGMMVQQLAE